MARLSSMFRRCVLGGTVVGWLATASPLTQAQPPQNATPPAEQPATAPPATEQPAQPVQAEQPSQPEQPAPVEQPAQAQPDTIISFDAAKPYDAEPIDPNKTITFQLQNAPWEMVLREFARKAGYTLQLLDIPPGTISYTDRRRYTPEEALDVIHGYLLQEGHVMVKRDRFLVVLNAEKRPIPPNLVPNVSVEELDQHGRHTLLNVVFSVEGAEVDEVAEEVQQLLGPQGKVVALTTSSALVVTDTATNLKRVQKLTENMTAGDLKFKSFPLKYINAEDAAFLVRSQLGIETGVTNVSQATYSRSRDRDRDSRSRPPTPTQTTEAQVTADLRTNSLLVTAEVAKLALVEEMMQSIDVPQGADGQGISLGRGKPYLKVYQLESSDAGEVAKTLAVLKPGYVVNEDGRHRRLHIMANESEHQEIADLIRQLDGMGGSQQVAVIPLSDIDPLAAAATLRSLFISDGDLAPAIEADTYGRRLLVRGSSDQVLQVKTLLAQLGEDGTATADVSYGSGPVRTIPLGGRDARAFANMLERVWSSSEDTPIRVVVPSEDSDPVRSERVPSAEEPLFRPTPSGQTDRDTEIDPVRSNLRTELERDRLLSFVNFPQAPSAAEADETDKQTARPAVPEVVLKADGTITLNGQSVAAIDDLGQSLAKLIDKTDAETDTEGTADTVRIIVDPQTPAPALSAVFAAVQEAGGRAILSTTETMPTAPKSAPAEPTQSSPVEPKTEEKPQEAPQPADSEADKSPVLVTVRDGELVLISKDEAALDRMEDMIERLAMAIPVQTRWTVFYLRSADATETVSMLSQLFPQSSIGTSLSSGDSSLMGSLTSGISSLGSSLMDATGLSTLGQGPQPLRIIPDVRSNSLFVTGPANQVDDIERMLKILDADELPENLRERLPQPIPVQYANVVEVSEIVKDVYKDYMEDPNQQRGGDRNNPFAAMMGGSRNNTRGRQPSGIRLTIGVDTRTSMLIVSANNELYNQIKVLVDELDQAAYEARATVRVVSVGEADTAVVQQAITSLLPTVTVSTTSSPSSGSASSSRSDDNNRGGGGDDDARRRFFEQMMRDRAEQGGSSSSSSNGSSSRFGRSRDGGDRSSRYGSSRGSYSRSGRGRD